MRTSLLALGLLALGLCLAAFPALADAIDGNWCRENGQRVSISGPSIVTPGGAKTQGEYSRHAFSYVVPAGEPGAGIEMRLLGEYDMQSRTAGTTVPLDWKRCGPATS